MSSQSQHSWHKVLIVIQHGIDIISIQRQQVYHKAAESTKQQHIIMSTRPIGWPSLIVFQILIPSKGPLMGYFTHTHTHTQASKHTNMASQSQHSWHKVLIFIQHGIDIISIQRQQVYHKAAASTKQQHVIMTFNQACSITQAQHHNNHQSKKPTIMFKDAYLYT